MILVTVGASQFPFDRLLHAVEDLAAEENVVVQHGPSTVRPRNARCFDYLELSTLLTLMRDAEAVVTHAGVGSILLSLRSGKQPLVVPRRRAFGETVDDHQLESARRLARAGLVTVVEDPAQLAPALARASETSMMLPVGESTLARELRDYLGGLIGAAALQP